MAKERDYSKVASRIVRPADMKRKPKLAVYARNKKGKTTFGLSAGVERTIVLDPEHGTSTMIAKNPHVLPIEAWRDVDDYYKFLKKGKHDYTWVLIDGNTRLHNMCLHHVMKQQEERNLDRLPGTVTKRDYGRAGELYKDMIVNFCNLEMGVVFAINERLDKGAGGDDDEEAEESEARVVPDLPQGVRGILNAEVDVIGRLYIAKTMVKKDGKKKEVLQRRLRIAPHERYDTGFRSDYVLPDVVVEPTIKKLVRLMREGVKEDG